LDHARKLLLKPFAEGWLQGSKAWGRPVDVLVMPDGALQVSDDEAGATYRISYSKNKAEQ
jgi:glucose/arabinose dehydrogenase